MKKDESKPTEKKIDVALTMQQAAFVAYVLTRFPIAAADPNFQHLHNALSAIKEALPVPPKDNLTPNKQT